ncbi:MAG: DUF3089 domain-containing protein [Eubacteriales bacterium]|nr:DUF3089 domain-containing protein [Eubacteriales bacterium]
MKRLLLMLTIAALCLLCGCALAEGDAPLDYAAPENWAYFTEDADKPADVFLICPTVDMGRNGNFNLSMADEKTKGNFVGALNMERGIYEDSAALFAPYYRQAAFPVYSMTETEAAPYFDFAYADVRAAFQYYLALSDRPFVLAGFSQGSDMALRLLKEFGETYADRLIAAYCIGWRVTGDDLAQCPWLKPAQGEDDLGVIVAFNSEAVDVTESLLVPAGVKTCAINPLNWKTDGTPADASLNLGACFTDYSGAIKSEIPHLTGAYLDEARGTLKVPDIHPADYANSLFPDGVYHLYDYQFFYRNLQQNVAARVERYLAQSALDNAA